MSTQHYRAPSVRNVVNPTCSFTGEDLAGTIGIHDGGSRGVNCEEVPMAYAEYRRRIETDDAPDIPSAPGMAVTPLYRASLPDDELDAARSLLHTERDEFTSDDWQALCSLIDAGWTVNWHSYDRSAHTTDEWCEPVKPFDTPR